MQDQFQTDSEGNITSDTITNTGSKSKSKYDNKECSVGEQLFLSNPSQSNDNLIDSTAGSCDPLFANQSLEQINLGMGITLFKPKKKNSLCKYFVFVRRRCNNNFNE